MSIQNTKLNTEVFDTVLSTVENSAKTASSVDHSFLVPDYIPPTTTIIAWNSYMEVGSTFGDELLSEFVKNDAGPPLSISILRDGVEVYKQTDFIGIQIEDMPQQFGFDNPNNPNFKYDVAFLDFLEVEPGIIEYTTRVKYQDGLPKPNSSHGIDGRKFDRRQTDSPQAGSSNFKSEPVFVAGVYPYYYGSSSTPMTTELLQELIDNNDPSLNLVISDSSKDVTIRYDSNEQYLWFAHASIYDQKNRWLNSDSTNGDIVSGGFIEKTGEAEISNSLWFVVNYTLYQSNVVSTAYEITYFV